MLRSALIPQEHSPSSKKVRAPCPSNAAPTKERGLGPPLALLCLSLTPPPRTLASFALPMACGWLMAGGELPREASAQRCSQRAPSAAGEVACSGISMEEEPGLMGQDVGERLSRLPSVLSLPQERAEGRGSSDRRRGLRSKY